MKASLETRLDYIRRQLTQARVDCEDPTVERRLEKIARVLNGAEPPLGKRNAVDLEAAVADPMDD